jgi:hypothetical protein
MTDTKDEKRETLAKTWERMATAVLRSLETEAPTAATLEAARKWLADNEITLATLSNLRGGALPAGLTLPTFTDDEQAASGRDPALTSVPPFAPPED